jgi:hypothetical protein
MVSTFNCKCGNANCLFETSSDSNESKLVVAAKCVNCKGKNSWIKKECYDSRHVTKCIECIEAEEKDTKNKEDQKKRKREKKVLSDKKTKITQQTTPSKQLFSSDDISKV